MKKRVCQHFDTSPYHISSDTKKYQFKCYLCIYFSYITHAVYHFSFFKDTK